MDTSIFSDLFELGLHPLPIRWNPKTKDADFYPEHINDVQSGNGKHDLNDVKRWLEKIRDANGIALKLHPPFFMLDFDLKNTDDKTVFNKWLNAVNAIDSNILSKFCIERTRSGGYHAYSKYKGVSKKITVAKNEKGSEVISIYTGSLLSFCYPTPGYELIHNEFSDIQELTKEEFDVIVSAAIPFNQYTPKESEYVPGEKIEYPDQYKNLAYQFDLLCTDDLWENLLNSITLYPTGDKKQFKGRTFYLYLREGSNAKFSAKVRFDRKYLYIFSGSFPKFPSFHTKVDENDHTWCITPTRLLYYSNGKDWVATIDQIKELCQQFNIDIKENLPEPAKLKQERPDRLQFPYDIFPQSVQDYINSQRIQKEYVAGGILGAAASAIGNTTSLMAMTGYIVKPILYMAIVAPPGASKTPALNKAFYPLEQYDKQFFAQYAEQLKEYHELLKEYEKDKKNNEKPELPTLRQILIKDSTIEMAIRILTTNTMGCCILSDELIGFLNRMNQYKAGDEVQKWLEMWSGSPILLQRITRGHERVESPFCCIVGGIQPGVLASMSTEEKAHNGFYHRFLFMYPNPEPKPEWQSLAVPDDILRGYKYFFEHLLSYRNQEPQILQLSPDADALYKQWFDFKNQYYNRAKSDNVKGIIAKYQDYCLRFALIIEVMDSFPERDQFVCRGSMERAIRLTEYFLGNMHKALKVLAPENPLDGVSDQWQEIITKMPDEFTTAEFVAICETGGVKSSTAKSFLIRNKELFTQIGRGKWQKMV